MTAHVDPVRVLTGRYGDDRAWDLERYQELDGYASLDNAFDFAGGAREPRFLSVDRDVKPQPAPRGLIYAMYGSGVAYASLLLLAATGRSRESPAVRRAISRGSCSTSSRAPATVSGRS